MIEEVEFMEKLPEGKPRRITIDRGSKVIRIGVTRSEFKAGWKMYLKLCEIMFDVSLVQLARTQKAVN
jgi:hypothetical protein